MTDDEIEAVADFFTHPSSVLGNSLALQIGEGTKVHDDAVRFFVARNALGLTGYTTKPAAIAALKERFQKTAQSEDSR